MSEIGKLSCPSSILDCLEERPIPEMKNILQNIDKCDDHTLVRKLTALLNLLSIEGVSQDFEALDGPEKILHLVDSKNKKIAKLTYLILVKYISRTDNEINSQFLNMHVFGALSKTLEDIDSLSYNFAQSALFFLSSVIALDKMGQILARKSKCLHRLIVLFLRIIPSLIRNENWEEEKAIRESKGHCETWKVLCLSIKKSISDPLNKCNQQQVNTILPKSINFLGDWIHYAKENDPLHEFVLSLVSLLVQGLFHNQMNQTSFAAYSGISIVIRGLNKLQGLPPSSSNSEIINKMIRLLNAAISGHKENCLLTISLGGMKVLLQLLKTLPDNKKFPVIVTLTHLVQKGDENDEKFVKTEGLSTLAVATVNADPTERQAAAKLLKSWASKISLYNNHQNKSTQNDQPFRSNSLLQFKSSAAFDHLGFNDKYQTKDHENNNTPFKEAIPIQEETLRIQLPKKSEDNTHSVPIVCCNEIIEDNLPIEQMDDLVYQNTLSIDKNKSHLNIIEQNENITPNEMNICKKIECKETMSLEKKNPKNDKESKVVSDLQQSKDFNCHEQRKGMEINKKNSSEQITDECNNRKMFSISTETTSVNDVFAYQSSPSENISIVNSNAMESKGFNSPDIEQENLNESSDSEYWSATDASFDSVLSFSSCNAECNSPTVTADDVTVNNSSAGSMETQCSSQVMSTQNEFEKSFNIYSNSSVSSIYDERNESNKRNRASYDNFVSNVTNYSGTEFHFPCQPVKHSTPRSKKPKIVKKCSVGRNGGDKILNYQNISLPSSIAGFSAVSLNSSISSSNKYSLAQLTQQEISYLEEGAARFGQNFQAIMESSFSITQE